MLKMETECEYTWNDEADTDAMASKLVMVCTGNPPTPDPHHHHHKSQLRDLNSPP